jgi:putative serine protease PepD
MSLPAPPPVLAPWSRPLEWIPPVTGDKGLASRVHGRLQAMALFLAGSVLVTSGVSLVLWHGLESRQSALESRERALTASVQRTDALSSRLAVLQQLIEGVSERLAPVEARVRSQPDVTSIVRTARASVFTIETDSALGTGFVASSADGRSELLTNFHVVASAWTSGDRRVRVIQGSRTYVGTIHRVNQASDLAAVWIPATFPVLRVQRQLPVPGDPVFVIGSPLGLEGTAANGIVSALRQGFIQFSAPVSPGDSGGPVLDGRGAVLGITDAKVISPGAEGLSFAIPIDTACRALGSC